MKKRLLKIVKIILLLLLISVITGILALLRMSFHTDNESIQKSFTKKGLKVEIYSLNGIRYAVIGNTKAKTGIFFIHGAPGGLSMFKKEMQDSLLQQKTLMISVDRLGYGGSDKGLPETSIVKQAEALLPILEAYPAQKWILYGYSYGAAVAAYMSYKKPTQTKAIILAGGAVSPDVEKFTWIGKVSNLMLIRWIASRETNVATKEKLSHKKALENISFIWKEIKVPILAQHGTADWIVPYENVAYLQKQLSSELLTIHKMEGENHFFIGKVKKTIPVILTLLEE